MLTSSTPGGGKLSILSPNAVLGVGPCPQPSSSLLCLRMDMFQVKALHHEVTCKNALLKAKCSEQEDLGWNVYNTLILMVQHMSGLSLAASLTLLASKVKRTLWQFTPVRWDKDEWHPLQATWHVIQVLTICIIFLTVALNTLFLKFSMWIPSTNPLILYSLILWLLIARAKALESDYVFDESSGYIYIFFSLSLLICRPH
ncbi:hypothetical protein Bca4012_096110 [Brassica carinata]